MRVQYIYIPPVSVGPMFGQCSTQLNGDKTLCAHFAYTTLLKSFFIIIIPGSSTFMLDAGCLPRHTHIVHTHTVHTHTVHTHTVHTHTVHTHIVHTHETPVLENPSRELHTGPYQTHPVGVGGDLLLGNGSNDTRSAHDPHYTTD
ncbi:hypothetical protein L209DRAFT_126934 [Thermothelomyces heterothallicus CBS 203.75]